MTITTTDHADSGEIPRLVGEERTVIIRRDTTEEHTQNLGPYGEFSRPIRRPEAKAKQVLDLDDTVIYMPETIGVVDQAAAQPIAPLERVAGAEDTAVHSILDSLAGARADLAGELTGPQIPPTPDPVPPPPPTPSKSLWQRLAYRGAHREDADRRVSPWTGLVIVVVAGLAMWAGLYLAAGWVIR